MSAMKMVRNNLPALLFFVAIGFSGCDRYAASERLKTGAERYELSILSTWSAKAAGAQPGELVSKVSLEVTP